MKRGTFFTLLEAVCLVAMVLTFIYFLRQIDRAGQSIILASLVSLIGGIAIGYVWHKYYVEAKPSDWDDDFDDEEEEEEE